jgi:hypothetical protein
MGYSETRAIRLSHNSKSLACLSST